MRTSSIKSFENHVKTLENLNEGLSKINKGNVIVSKWGRVLVHITAKHKTTNMTGIYNTDISRNELTKFGIRLALNMKDPEKAKELLEEFKTGMKKLEGDVEGVIAEKQGKRVKVGRKLASFSKHFFDRDKKIDKAIDKLDKKIEKLHEQGATSELEEESE